MADDGGEQSWEDLFANLRGFWEHYRQCGPRSSFCAEVQLKEIAELEAAAADLAAAVDKLKVAERHPLAGRV